MPDSMPTALLPDWSPELLIYLGVGYIAYRLSYVGLNKNHTARDSIFMILIFAAVIGWPSFKVGDLIWRQFSDLPDNQTSEYSIAFAAVFAAISAVIVGILWRSWGKYRWQDLLNFFELREDGIPTAWASLVQESHKRGVSQVEVHTTDGSVHYLDDRGQYLHAPFEGIYLGTDGDVAMIVDAIKEQNGKEIKLRGTVDDYYGTRVSYFPASSIKMVNIRMI